MFFSQAARRNCLPHCSQPDAFNRGGLHGTRTDLYWETSEHFCLSSKGKAVLLQAWSGPEGSGKLRFPDFMTTTQDGGKVVSLTHQPPLPPGNAP